MESAILDSNVRKSVSTSNLHYYVYKGIVENERIMKILLALLNRSILEGRPLRRWLTQHVKILKKRRAMK